MPVHTYFCSTCQSCADEIFLGSETVPQTLTCLCGATMERGRVYRFRHVGPVFHDLMQIEENLLGKTKMAQGQRIRSKRDVEKWEKDNNLVRCTAQQARVNMEYSEEMAYEQGKIISTEGRDGWFEHCNKSDIKNITGWDDNQYVRWRNMNNAEERRIKSGQHESGPVDTST